MSVTFGPVIVVLVDPLAVWSRDDGAAGGGGRGFLGCVLGAEEDLEGFDVQQHITRDAGDLLVLARIRRGRGWRVGPLAGGRWRGGRRLGWRRSRSGRRSRRRIGAGDVLELVEMRPELLELRADAGIDSVGRLGRAARTDRARSPRGRFRRFEQRVERRVNLLVRVVPPGADRKHRVEVGDELLHQLARVARELSGRRQLRQLAQCVARVGQVLAGEVLVRAGRRRRSGLRRSGRGDRERRRHESYRQPRSGVGEVP